ncbi:MAG: cyclic pyranopterin monophosphate synthase MoaC [Candidatus Heimdallarchaeaceae archaeon]
MLERKVSMVDISQKPPIRRKAIAKGRIYLKKTTLEKIQSKEIHKGDPIIVGEIAATTAVKQTPLLIPLCHQIPITKVDFKYKIEEEFIEVFVEVEAVAKTGVEMEALVGVTTFLNVIWDMTKYLEKDDKGQYPTTRITDILIVEKSKKEE